MAPEKLKKYSDGIIHLYLDGTMEKRHIFNLIAFLFAISFLSLIGVKPGITYAVWIAIIVVVLGLLYYWCKEDTDGMDKYSG